MDDLAALSDEFDDPARLAEWYRVFEGEGYSADQLERYEVEPARSMLTKVPYASAWDQDYRSVLTCKEVAGDFG